MMLYVCWLGLAATPVIVALNAANCTDSQYYWTFNSLGQSPCSVADVLMIYCTGQAVIIPAIPPGEQYAPLGSTGANVKCFCNTVWYSLMSACAACQNGYWPTWPNYSAVCPQIYLMHPIPVSNTSVPNWAYVNVTATNNTFNVAAASILAAEDTPTDSVSLTSTSASTSFTSTSASTSTSTIPALILASITPAVLSEVLS
ncbi:hypothetical protein F5887DRAFT_475487 [Amanita rubescens]|nr:hypothetical protein F5887DRAFT_475487 [Amanita rubescens]